MTGGATAGAKALLPTPRIVTVGASGQSVYLDTLNHIDLHEPTPSGLVPRGVTDAILARHIRGDRIHSEDENLVATKTIRIAIVGAGLRGLASAAFLKSVGVNVRVFEKERAIGGVWLKVHGGARINTPSYGYSFHSSNRWTCLRPCASEILENLKRMIQQAGLEESIELSTPVESVSKTASGAWTVNDRKEEYDGLLVCPGHLGTSRRPPPELVADFAGDIACAYEVKPESLRNRHVVVVGSGSSALDMLALARDSDCLRATLCIFPGVEIRDVRQHETMVHAVASNPLLYKLTKRPGGRPAAIRSGIDEVLASSRVEVVRDGITSFTGRTVQTAQKDSIDADIIVWCTGWQSPTPCWALDHTTDPTMVLAGCRNCLDTAGFGFGCATVHAKALLATLEYGLRDRFSSGTSYCKCEDDGYVFTRHILINLALFYFAQPVRWRLLGREFHRGLKGNINRMKNLDEPRWASLLAFLNAPFGF